MPGPKRRRKRLVHRHWSGESLFIHAEGTHRNTLLTAWQVKAAVESNDLSPEQMLGVVGFPDTKIYAYRVVELLLAKGYRHQIADYGLPIAPLLSPPTRPLAPLRNVDSPERSALPRPDPWWQKFLTLKGALWAGLIYCVLGFGIQFFLAGNPELTAGGIAWGVIGAFAKTAALLVGLVLWAGMMTTFWRSETIGSVVLALFALGTLWGATLAYREGYVHLQANQLAPLTTLVEKCLQEGVQTGSSRIGAKCEDGSNSRATGSGACSHHGGVAYWKYREKQTRTLSQCQNMAQARSWN